MSRSYWLALILAILGFVSGCGGNSMPTKAPPGDPALDNIDDGSAYDLPEQEDAADEAAPAE